MLRNALDEEEKERHRSLHSAYLGRESCPFFFRFPHVLPPKRTCAGNLTWASEDFFLRKTTSIGTLRTLYHQWN
jgi:hypothetical protein